MGNNVLPARGGDVLRAVLLKPRSTASLRTIFGTLVAERLLDVVFLLSLFAVLAYAVLGDIETPNTDLLLLGGSAVWLLLLALRFGDLPAAGPAHRRAGTEAWRHRSLSPRDACAACTPQSMLGWTALIWVSEGLMFVLVADSVGVEMDLIQAGYLMAVASVFLLIPAGPGNVGTLDAAVLFGLGAIGTSGSEALSYLLMYRFVIFVPITVVGVVLLLTRYRRPPPVAPEAG